MEKKAIIVFTMEGSVYFTPHSKEKTGGRWAWAGPNTKCFSQQSENISAECNWFRTGFRDVKIFCKYVKKLTFFVAFSDYVINMSNRFNEYEGYLGDIEIEILEAQTVRNYYYDSVPYIPMKAWAHGI